MLATVSDLGRNFSSYAIEQEVRQMGEQEDWLCPGRNKRSRRNEGLSTNTSARTIVERRHRSESRATLHGNEESQIP